jgi:NADPH:quinone reductase
MRAVVFDQTGEPSNVLRLATVADPKPGDGSVLVQVTARPIHPADLAFIRGQYRIRPTFPQVAGLEGYGTVMENDRGIAPGSRVAFRWPGSWAEIAAVPVTQIVEVPADIAPDTACQVSLNPVTAWALLDEANVGAGDWIMLTAAMSTVSNLIAEIARKRGLRMIGLVRGDVGAAAERTGADLVLSTADPEIANKVAAATGEQRVSALLDSVGGALLPTLFTMLAPGARIIAYGVQDREAASITNAMMVYSNLIWKGFGIDRWLSGQAPAVRQAMFDDLWSMIRNGVLSLPVAARHPLERFLEAIAEDSRPKRMGKVIIT